MTPNEKARPAGPARRGLLFVLSGPSGVGKGTLVKRLIAEHPELDVALSISATTRAPRPGEEDGVHYRFCTESTFRRMVTQGELLEYAQFANGCFYGTPKAYVEAMLEAGRDVILEIDVKGAIQIKERLPNGVYVFVLPPSFEELEARLKSRQTEDAEAVRRRLAAAVDELDYLPLYDYQVVNDDLDDALDRLKAIIRAEHSRVQRHLAHA